MRRPGHLQAGAAVQLDAAGGGDDHPDVERRGQTVGRQDHRQEPVPVTGRDDELSGGRGHRDRQVETGRGQGQVEAGLDGPEFQPGAVGGPEDERGNTRRWRLPGGGNRHTRVGAGDALAERQALRADDEGRYVPLAGHGDGPVAARGGPVERPGELHDQAGGVAGVRRRPGLDGDPEERPGQRPVRLQPGNPNGQPGHEAEVERRQVDRVRIHRWIRQVALVREAAGVGLTVVGRRIGRRDVDGRRRVELAPVERPRQVDGIEQGPDHREEQGGRGMSVRRRGEVVGKVDRAQRGPRLVEQRIDAVEVQFVAEPRAAYHGVAVHHRRLRGVELRRTDEGEDGDQPEQARVESPQVDAGELAGEIDAQPLQPMRQSRIGYRVLQRREGGGRFPGRVGDGLQLRPAVQVVVLQRGQGGGCLGQVGERRGQAGIAGGVGRLSYQAQQHLSTGVDTTGDHQRLDESLGLGQQCPRHSRHVAAPLGHPGHSGRPLAEPYPPRRDPGYISRQMVSGRHTCRHSSSSIG